MRRSIFPLLMGLVWPVLGISPALATNGMNMIGFNARSSGMGGADVAVASGAAGVAGNPTTLCGSRADSEAVGIGLLAPRLGMKNTAFGPNDTGGEDQLFPLPYAAVSRGLGADSPWTLGIALHAQGGMGVDFQDVRTFAGTEDDFSSTVQYVRLSPAASFRVNESLSLGATLLAGYARAEFSLFPDTYSPGFDGAPGTADDFAGMDLASLSSFGYAARFGALCRLGERVTFGAAYTTPSAMDFDGGDLTVNFGAGRATYDAEMDGFTWPAEAEVGLAVQASPRLLVAADVKWLGWSSAIDEITVKGSDPDQPGVPPAVEVPFAMQWRDQWVFAVGAEYALAPRHTLRAGYNYGRSPVPDQYVTPLFPATVEHHVTVGYSHDRGRWTFDLAFEHSFPHTQKNTGTDPAVNPFGPDVEVESRAGNVLHLGLTHWH